MWHNKTTNSLARVFLIILTMVLVAGVSVMSTGCGGGNGSAGKEEPIPAPAPVAPVSVHQHVWTDATHEEPKTCSECGETEGEALPHEWCKANYQEPKICELCGETEGEPLPPLFPTLGFELKEIGAGYPYKSCFEDLSDAMGEAIVSDVRITNGDEYFEPKDGHEWVIATSAVMVPKNPKTFQIGIERFDYYSYDLSSAFPTNVVNYYGVDYEVAVKTRILENTAIKMEFEIGYLVPAGYDGVIFCFFNDYHNMVIDYNNPDTAVIFDDIIDGDTLFFRLRK